MKSTKTIIILTAIILISASFAIIRLTISPKKYIPNQNTPSNTMKLSSPSFENNGYIPPKYTCDGQNISPELEISDIPENAKSLALIVDDPDAPAGDWVHWLVWNINPGTAKIGEGEIPQNSIQGLNDFGKNNYGGPCPPSGTHRYQFKLYALDINLSLPQTAGKKDLLRAIDTHIIEQTMLIGLYSRQH